MTGDYYDFDELKSDVFKIIKYSQGYPDEVFKVQGDVGVEELLSDWQENKKHFINLFGGRLIYPCGKVSATIAQESKDRYFREFIADARNKRYINSLELDKFLVDNKEGFFDNVVVSPRENLNIECGAKLLKSLKKFDNDVRKLQDLASFYIQKDKIEGYLYLSVDPRDYLTISDNNHKWRSCHSLDGDYRTGNLSYMADVTTIIAYITEKENDQQKLKCLPEGMTWNSKIWRMLIHINPDSGIYYGRQYPFESTELLFAADGHVRSLYPNEFVCPKMVSVSTVGGPNSNFETWNNYFFFNGELISSEDCVDYTGYCGYTDLYATASNVWFAAKKSLMTAAGNNAPINTRLHLHRLFDIKVGRRVRCLSCGVYPVNSSKSMLCDICRGKFGLEVDTYTKCYWCGHRIYPEDKQYKMDGEVFCRSCYNRYKGERQEDG